MPRKPPPPPPQYRVLVDSLAYLGADGEEHRVTHGDVVADIPEATAANWLAGHVIEEA